MVKNRKGFHSEVATWAAKHGYEELRADGRWYPTDATFRLDRFKEHDIEVVVGIIAGTPGKSGRRAGNAAGGVLSPGPGKTAQQLVDEALSA